MSANSSKSAPGGSSLSVTMMKTLIFVLSKLFFLFVAYAFLSVTVLPLAVKLPVAESADAAETTSRRRAPMARAVLRRCIVLLLKLSGTERSYRETSVKVVALDLVDAWQRPEFLRFH